MVFSTKCTSPDQIAACQALVYNLLQRTTIRPDQQGFGIAIGLVSVHPGAGVSHVQGLLDNMLNENEKLSAISVDCLALAGPDHDMASTTSSATDKSSNWSEMIPRNIIGRFKDRVMRINELKQSYSYALIDCHSLKTHSDVLGLAKALDGIILVIEADQTTLNQLSYLVRSIEERGGKILGHVFNKRTYPIPVWINSHMERLGF